MMRYSRMVLAACVLGGCLAACVQQNDWPPTVSTGCPDDSYCGSGEPGGPDSGIIYGDGGPSASPMLAMIDPNATMNQTPGRESRLTQYTSTSDSDRAGTGTSTGPATPRSPACRATSPSASASPAAASPASSQGFAQTDQLAGGGMNGAAQSTSFTANTTTTTQVQGVKFDTQPGAVITLSGGARGGVQRGVPLLRAGRPDQRRLHRRAHRPARPAVHEPLRGALPRLTLDVVVGLGSNLGDRLAHLTDAVRKIGASPGLWRDRRSSRRRPSGLPSRTTSTPPSGSRRLRGFEEVLATLLAIERRLGRVRTAGVRWEARTIDSSTSSGPTGSSCRPRPSRCLTRDRPSGPSPSARCSRLRPMPSTLARARASSPFLPTPAFGAPASSCS